MILSKSFRMSLDIKMSTEEIIEKVIAGEIKLHTIDKYVSPKEAVAVRRSAIAQLTDTGLDNIGSFTIDETQATARNIENMIGAVQVPLGIAGPIIINGEYAIGNFSLPMATTEGALVASTNRGCSVITASGGAEVRIFNDGMTRAPVYLARNASHAKDFINWINENFEILQAKAAQTTRFGELLDVLPFVVGNNIYLRFRFDTKDAMGMNMATIASEAISEYITQQCDIQLVSLSGNMCTDKKPSAINNIMGRGKTVVADVVIPGEVVILKLKTHPDNMVEVNYRKNLLGSARAGSMGFNAQAANIIAALYLACGQDAAHVVEASSAITTMDLTKEGNLYCSVTLSAIQVGTVGGGTGLATQKECLRMLGVAGSGQPPGTNATKLAEIIASAVLAGEISLIGAQAAGHLARAHKQLGRG
ncbi:MAG: 3-hydroxy-3-methylglutaryl-coenzyme A reductase [ANME-2 cluster archaeon HR1]|nr:MAG: 3-hydroxy-3-methylglutaryl-coenzyme A reductase [ANME-2 cluster archaeon HR1]